MFLLLGLLFSSHIMCLDSSCFELSDLSLNEVKDFQRVKDLEIRGQWLRFEEIKVKELSSCDLKVIDLLIKSQEHFLDQEVREYDCLKKKSEIVCEEILIDECCILNWRLEEIKKWKELRNKKGRR